MQRKCSGSSKANEVINVRVISEMELVRKYKQEAAFFYTFPVCTKQRNNIFLLRYNKTVNAKFIHYNNLAASAYTPVNSYLVESPLHLITALNLFG